MAQVSLCHQHSNTTNQREPASRPLNNFPSRNSKPTHRDAKMQKSSLSQQQAIAPHDQIDTHALEPMLHPQKRLMDPHRKSPAWWSIGLKNNMAAVLGHVPVPKQTTKGFHPHKNPVHGSALVY